LSAGQGSHRWPQFLPDGRRFIFMAALGQAQTRGVYVASLDGGEPTRVMVAETHTAYAPGYLLRVAQGVLVAQRFDEAHATLTGEPFPVAQAVGADDGSLRSAFSVAAGVLAHRSGTASRRQLVWADREGKVLGIVGPADANGPAGPANLALDSYAQRVAVQRNVQGNTDVWLLDRRGVASRLTFDAAIDSRPIWSPDGTQIVFASTRRGGGDLFVKPASGSANEQPLLVDDRQKAPLDWSADGHALLFSVQDPKDGSDLWALPLTGERKPFPVVQSSFDDIEGQFSPDARWLAYASNESGRYEVYVRPFPGQGGKWQVSTAGGTQPRWRSDGKELFYVSPDSRMMAAPIHLASDAKAADVGAPAELFPTRLPTGTSIAVTGVNARTQYAVARDGRFLMFTTIDDAVTSPITIELNWAAALARKRDGSN